MADNLTKSQRDIHNVLFDITDRQRTFGHNYADTLSELPRKTSYEVTVAIGAGLVLGGLVGAIVGLKRRG
jgi:hypothetical protein